MKWSDLGISPEDLMEDGPPSTAESLIAHGKALVFSETVDDILSEALEEGVTVPQADAMRRMATEAVRSSRPQPQRAWQVATGIADVEIGPVFEELHA